MADSIQAAWDPALNNLLATGIVLFMHGIYFVLVVLALRFLRQRRPPRAGLFGCLIAGMFVISTADMVLQIGATLLYLKSLHSSAQDSTTTYPEDVQHAVEAIAFAEGLLVVTNNAIADGLLTYRCYVIWTKSHQNVAIIPVLLALASAASGYVSTYQYFSARHISSSAEADYRVFYGLIVATNMTLTSLTVGRILYTRRDLQLMGETKYVSRYNAAMKMILESAVLYLLFSCAGIIARSLGKFAAVDALYALCGTSMNIVPALLVVRISLAAKHKTTTSACSNKNDRHGNLHFSE
ncbi:hypothetical protein B0H17DRAFT_1221963 [Mycena rosella]|uniref:Uncharacterized protein n=1 Tax=Mycena rosella TaxID=1033263 RepID=A0AAD7F6R0_MYCRO|nr:hypothetical protein B0H17DRAFT_1221963 [Mycena rosella]